MTIPEEGICTGGVGELFLESLEDLVDGERRSTEGAFVSVMLIP